MKYRSILTVIVFLILGFLQGCGGKDAESRFQKGLGFFQQQNYARAAIEFQNCIQQDPNHTEGRYHLALCFIESGKLSSARPQLERVLEDDPAHIGARVAYIPFQIAQGEVSQALRTVEDALVRDPDNVRPLNTLARSQLEQGNIFEALNTIERALEIDSGNLDVKSTYAQICLQIANRYRTDQPSAGREENQITSVWEEKAETTLNEILAENPDNLDALLMRCQLLISQGDLQHAQKTYQRMTELYPEDSRVIASHAEFLLAKGKFEESVEILSEAIRKQGSNPALEVLLADALTGLALQARSAGDESRSDELIEQARSLLATNRAKGLSLANIYTLQGKFIEAEDVYDHRLDLSQNPRERLQALFYFGLHSILAGDMDRAESLNSELQSRFPRYLETARLSALLSQSQEEAKEKANRIFRQEGWPLQRILHNAYRLHSQDSPEEAMQLLDLAQELAPDSPLPDFYRGTLLLSERDKKDEARSHFQKALDKDPFFPHALISIAEVERSRENYEEALKNYRDALQLVPDSQSIKSDLAATLVASGKTMEAFQVADEMIAQNPDSTFLFELMNKILPRGFFDGSPEERIKEILQESPRNVFAQILQAIHYRQQAQNFRQQGLMEEARRMYSLNIETLSNCLQDNPTSVLLMHLLAQVNSETGNLEESNTLCERIVRLRTDYRPAYVTLIGNKEREGKWSEALEHCEKALDSFPEDNGFLLSQAELLSRQGRTVEATNILRSLQRREPLNPACLSLLVRIAIQKNRLSEAIGLLEGIISIEHSNPRPYIILADLYRRTGKFQAADKILQTARREFPEDKDLLLEIANSFKARGEHRAAIEQYKGALAKHPNDLRIISQLAREYILLEQQEEAIGLMERIENRRARVALLLDLASYSLQNRQPDISKRLCNLVLEYDPNSLAAQIGLARVAASERDKSQALSHYQSSIESVSPSIKPALLLEAARVASASWGQSLMDWRKDLERAEAFCTEALEMQGERQSPVLLLLAKIKSAQEDYSSEATYIEKALQEDPDNTAFQLLLARAKERNGKKEESREILEEVVRSLALSENPEQTIARIGNSLAELLGSNEELLAQYSGDEEDYIGQLLLGIVSLNRSSGADASSEERKSAAREALRHFENVQEQRPLSPIGYKMAAIAYTQNNEEDKALEALHDWLEVSPSDHASRIQYARTLARQGKMDEALEELEFVLENEPGDVNALITKASVLSTPAINKREEAISILRDVLEEYPANAEAGLRLLSLLRRQGKVLEAIQLAESFMENNPRNYGFIINLGELYLRQQEHRKAIDCYEKAFSMTPNSPHAMNNLAYAYAAAETNLDRAMELVEKALDKLPADPNFLDTLGFIYMKKGNMDKAIEVFTETLELTPESSAIRYHLASAHFKNGSIELAERVLTEAQESDGPVDPMAEDLLKRIRKSKATAQ